MPDQEPNRQAEDRGGQPAGAGLCYWNAEQEFSCQRLKGAKDVRYVEGWGVR